MAKAGFIVAFDGPGVKDGRIDVRDLAPALLSLGRIIDAANVAVNGEKRPINVEVKAVTVGSFQVHLDAVLSGWDMLKRVMDRPDVDEAKKLLEWLGLLGIPGVPSLFGLYRWLGGRRPSKVVKEANGQFRFEIEGRHLVVPFEVMRLYQERAVAQAVGDLIKVIESETIDRVDFFPEGGTADIPAQTLTAADRPAFLITEPPPEVVVDEIRPLALSIRSLAFQEGNKWRLFDGQNVITATIEDDIFIDRVDRNLVRFAKGDILLCEVHTIQRQSQAGLTTDHAVLRVIEHRAAPAQIQLPFFEDS